MPLYFCYCPDPPNNLETRLKARPAHFEMFTKDLESGAAVMGRGLLRESAATRAPGAAAPADEQVRNLVGSVMVLRCATLAAAWERVRADPYWTAGVWDHARVTVEEMIAADGDATLRCVS